MKRFFESLLLALGFLTVFPTPQKRAPQSDEFGETLKYFPVIGVLIGVAVACFDFGAGKVLPVGVTSVLTVILFAAVSGGLHIDGLADTADGFFSSRPREKILEIMKDSRIGAMGVLAIVSVFALKTALVFSLPMNDRFAVLLLMPVAGRFAPVCLIYAMDYVGREGGLGNLFARKGDRKTLVVAAIITVLAFVIVEGTAGVAVFFALIFTAALLGKYIKSKIGGYTGDTLGAAVEICELIPALTILFIRGA